MHDREETMVCSEDIALQNQYIHSIRELNKDRLKKYKLETFGCQMNENDSERLDGMLSEMGYVKTADMQECDLILYNTCCVRENAELKVFGHLGALKKYKAAKPDMVIAVCGCMMQQKEVAEHIRKTYRHVNLVFGTHNLHQFPELLYRALESGRRVFEIWESEGLIAEGMPIRRQEGVKAWVTVMYGCNNFCSYCIVPYVRGRERSRKQDDILHEVRMLGQQGCKEITLLGQNVNSYGKDLEYKDGFASLLYAIEDVPGIERIRFMTSHPKDLSKALMKAMGECQKVCRHMHLPIQSGSSRILQKMNRKYSREQYLGLVDAIRETVPGISLTTDIIVGFPEETGDDFSDTLDMLERVRFDTAYTFIYSKRTGTPASKNPEQVSEDVKKERFERLVAVQNRISKEINDVMVGRDEVILVEGFSKSSRNTLTGRTDTNKIVNFKGVKEQIGQLITVNITKSQTWSLEGTIR